MALTTSDKVYNYQRNVFKKSIIKSINTELFILILIFLSVCLYKYIGNFSNIHNYYLKFVNICFMKSK